jgi:3'(2'), 5'-bisphosphate nucleotidase/myo-inositol-1(or 4)-monophosphatase
VDCAQFDSIAGRVEVILQELGMHLLEWRSRGDNVGQWRGKEFKSEADRQAHDFLVRRLRELWPYIPVVSEEDVGSQGEARPPRYWLIDPIDGTASYCDGFEGFVTQVALMEAERPVLGVVHAPALALTYCGRAGADSTRNGQPIVVAPARETLTLIDNYPQPRGIARSLCNVLAIRNYVESGSIALKICRVADGTADIFVKDVVVRDWDLAAAHVVLEGAGGTLTDFSGQPIAYRGRMEKHGLVAAASPMLAERVDRVCRPQSGIIL